MSTFSKDFSNDPPISPPAETPEFLVLNHTHDSWQIRLNIPSKELIEQEALLFHLRKVKAEIARMYNIKETALSFGDIERREVFENYVEIVVSLFSIKRTSGEPIIHFRPDIQDQVTYVNMIASMDVAYLDEQGKPITLQKVKDAISRSKIDPAFLDNDAVVKTVQEVLDKKTAVSGVIIARGRFPGRSRNSEIMYHFPTCMSRDDTAKYLSARQVKSGDIICQKTSPAVTGADGSDVRGKRIPASPGQDIELQTDIGTKLSADGFKVIATTDGIVTYANTSKLVHTAGGLVSVPAILQIKVNQLTRVDGNKVVRFNSSDTIEVNGNLCSGSYVVTEGEVIISGSVENNTSIEAVDSIAVSGRVNGATLNSQSNIVTWDNVVKSKLIARGQIVSQGNVLDSELTADTIHVEKTSGSQFIAETCVSMFSAEQVENSAMTSVNVGISEFLRFRINENSRYIDFAKSTLSQLETVFGRSLVDQTNRSNVQILFMRFLAQLNIPNAEKERRVDTYRALIQHIPPIQQLMKVKQSETNELHARIDSSPSDGGIVIVRNKLNAPVKVSIGGQRTILPAGNSPVRIRKNEVGALVMETL
jgi:uncharacterized protein (DUF342 family)